MIKIFRYSYGQVMPLTALFLGFVSLTTIFLYNSNIIVIERVKLQNTADSAAFSTAAVDARYLNFVAYSNRAMIANHVIAAQSIGIASNGKMLKQTGENAEQVLGIIPYYGTYYINPLAIGLKYYSEGLDVYADVAIPIANYTTKALSLAQQSYRKALPIASISITKKIIAANDKHGELSTVIALGHDTQLANFLDIFSPDKASSNAHQKERADEFYGITMNSRNRFTSSRSGDWGDELKIPFVFELRPVKYGGTDMSNGSSGPKSAKKYATWAGMDTLSFSYRTFTCRSRWGIPRWCSYKEIPFGYGSGTASEDYNFFNDRNSSLYGSGAWRNSAGASMQAAYGDKYTNKNYDGMLEFIDLKQKGRVDSAPTVFIALNKSESHIATAKSLGIFSDSIDISEKGSLRKGTQFTLAKAAAYFERTQELDSPALQSGKKREFGNLYNPFWVPKLQDSTMSEAQSLLVVVNGT